MTSIRLEGAILSADLLDAIERGAEGKHSQRPADFGLPSGSAVRDDIQSAWATAKTLWTAYQAKLDALRPGATGTTETRNLFISPLLALLGYQPQLTDAETVADKSFAISHRDATRDGFPLHVIGPLHPDPSIGPDKSTLDVKIKGVSRMSPHALVQEYLNLTEHLYALVTNGRQLRLLRDSSRLIKLSFLEFDFERIFEDELFSDFALLYRLLHASRMPADQAGVAESVIERYHQDSLDSGSRIREGLAKAVEASILDLANGFLAHPDNDDLRQAAASDTFPIHALATERTFSGPFYQSLLRLIYRLLFLLVTEERGLIQPRSTDRRKIRIYRDFYSLTRLRRLAESIRFHDKRHTDAWQSLLRCFQLFEPGNKGAPLDIRPLGGLFDRDVLGILSRCQLDNRTLLRCLRKLSLFQHPDTKQWMRVNYAALNVEEFGSVYEGLLEYDPAVTETVPGQWQFQFVKGDARASSGSHYTPDELVQPLIKHSLDHLIEDRIKKAKAKIQAAPKNLHPSSFTLHTSEKALLSLTVCDVACGSGHILLSAARRIGTELAILRSGEDQPSPPALRKAIRDVIRSCIYGVDLNPLAVELCKVALWLEAHVPGEPLNFLDHRIKCGNAIVGLARQEELQRGIPDEAFKTLPGDDKQTAAALRKQNKQERKGFQELPWGQSRQDDLAALQAELAEITALPESIPEEIHHKQERYAAYQHGKHLRNLKTLADLQVAQFYLPKTEESRSKITTHDQYGKYLRGESFHAEPTAAAQAVAGRKRFFHWFLEFPEVFGEEGFACILGNPPYLGGRNIGLRYGPRVSNILKFLYPTTAGNCDLVANFILRATSLTNPEGFTAYITTNTVAQGETRKGGLESFMANGGIINFAIPAITWPGRAAVVVALLALTKSKKKLPITLDGNQVDYISSYLDALIDLGEPYTLKANSGLSYKGSEPSMGFVIEPPEAETLISNCPSNADVLSSYLNGDDLNSSIEQHPSRSVINFFNWSLEKAQSYPGPFNIVEQSVKALWEAETDKSNTANWWWHRRRSEKLYRAIRGFQQCPAVGFSSKYGRFSLVPANIVFSNLIVVICIEEPWAYAVVDSSLHECWAWRYSSKLGSSTLRYTPSAAFETFPLPPNASASESLSTVSIAIHEHRRRLMLLMQLGLTKTYNLFHARDLTEEAVVKASKQGPEVAAQAYADILTLRDLHRQMDEAVLVAYGWHQDTDDGTKTVELKHDFYEVDYLPENDRIRYTIHPDARKELLKLNHQRHAEEVAQGLHDKKKGKKKTARKKAPQRSKHDDELI